MRSRYSLLGMVFALFLLPGAVLAVLNRNLQLGSEGEDVRELQRILNQDSQTRIATQGSGSPGNETNYFGRLTFEAVKRFQQKYSMQVLSPVGLTSPTGFVGAMTRAMLNKLVSSSVPPPPPAYVLPPPPPPASTTFAPVISSVSPAVIIQGATELLIVGSNFTSSQNTVLVSSENPGAFVSINSSDGTTLRITLRLSAMDGLRRALAPFKAQGSYNDVATAIASNIRERIPGEQDAIVPVEIVIRNGNGTSKPFKFHVNITKILEEIGRTSS